MYFDLKNANKVCCRDVQNKWICFIFIYLSKLICLHGNRSRRLRKIYCVIFNGSFRNKKFRSSLFGFLWNENLDEFCMLMSFSLRLSIYFSFVIWNLIQIFVIYDYEWNKNSYIRCLNCQLRYLETSQLTIT